MCIRNKIKGSFHREHTGSNFDLEFGLDPIFRHYKEYADVFAFFGNVERLKIIVSLFDEPQSAKELMQSTQMRTTGQVYHHLDDLEKIGLIVKDEDKYRVQGSYVSTIAILFAGVHYLKKKALKYGKPESDE